MGAKNVFVGTFYSHNVGFTRTTHTQNTPPPAPEPHPATQHWVLALKVSPMSTHIGWMKFVRFGAMASCKTATLLPVTLLNVRFATFIETSLGLEPFWFRRPRTTVQSEALLDLDKKGIRLNQIILISLIRCPFFTFKCHYLVKQLAELMTKRSAISVPPQTWLPFSCRLAIHGHMPADTRALFPPKRVFRLARPHTTATVTEGKRMNSRFYQSNISLICFRLNFHKIWLLKEQK